jgi:hypothetical protein
MHFDAQVKFYILESWHKKQISKKYYILLGVSNGLEGPHASSKRVNELRENYV